MVKLNGRFVEVPPPARVPVQEEAARLGLLPGLRVVVQDYPCRCCNCDGWIRRGETMAWVPDGIRIGDQRDLIIEQCRLGAFNGNSSGWCLACARRLAAPSVRGFLRRIFGL